MRQQKGNVSYLSSYKLASTKYYKCCGEVFLNFFRAKMKIKPVMNAASYVSHYKEEIHSKR
jgi:hypothetical protein